MIQYIANLWSSISQTSDPSHCQPMIKHIANQWSSTSQTSDPSHCQPMIQHIANQWASTSLPLNYEEFFVFRTVKDNEKTVGVAVSASRSALYDSFPSFKTEVKTFQTGLSSFPKLRNRISRAVNKLITLKMVFMLNPEGLNLFLY